MTFFLYSFIGVLVTIALLYYLYRSLRATFISLSRMGKIIGHFFSSAGESLNKIHAPTEATAHKLTESEKIVQALSIRERIRQERDDKRMQRLLRSLDRWESATTAEFDERFSPATLRQSCKNHRK
ncbi:MAG: hypothetical protein J6M18_02320 [Actinomycetaceae bacterium]|nr:hypothetical protein [Actinomycetaceae bacterium]